MAAPLMAQSDDISVKIALDLLQQSQTLSAAGHHEAAAELAAKAQAILGGGELHEAHGEHGAHDHPEVIIKGGIPSPDDRVLIGPDGVISTMGADRKTMTLEVISSRQLEEICEEKVECEDSGDFEFIMKDMDKLKDIEMFVMRMDGNRDRFPGLPGGAPHAMRGGMPHAPHAMQGGGDVHMQLQAVQLELQALRLELQALRMQMGAMRGGMGNRMAPMQMGHMLPQMNMGRGMTLPRSEGMHQIQLRGMSFPGGNMHMEKGEPQHMFLRQIHENNGPGMMFFGGEWDENPDQDNCGGADGEWEEDFDMGQFDFEFDEMMEGAGTKLEGLPGAHTQMKLIINGKVYEGEEARKKMEELGMGEMGGHLRMSIHGTPQASDAPSAPKRLRIHREHNSENL